MNKIIFLSMIMVICCSCSDDNLCQLDGMWQLKTVQDDKGNTVHVDTIFYSFHREVVFSFTVLENPSNSFLFYGYIEEKISDNKVHILIDNKFDDNDRIKHFLKYSGWSSINVVFDIKKYNKSDLILFDSENGKTYTLKKF